LFLFILEGRLYAACELLKEQMVPLLLSEYFRKAACREEAFLLYETSPVLFKAFLSLAQVAPSVVATSKLIEIERLLLHVEDKGEEALLLLRRGERAHLFYFLKGALCDAYMEETDEMREEPELRDKLLLCAYTSQEAPSKILLYEDIHILPASDSEDRKRRAEATSTLEEAVFQEGQKGAISEEHKPSEAFSEADKELWLEVLSGERTGHLIRLSSERLSMGRGRVDVRFSDPQISRYHAELKRAQTGLSVIDRHSTNGLFVNGKKVLKAELHPDDVIRMGDTSLRVIEAK